MEGGRKEGSVKRKGGKGGREIWGLIKNVANFILNNYFCNRLINV